MVFLELFGELGTTLPFIYRGWAFILIPSYRKAVRLEFRRRHWLLNLIDLLLTLSVLAAEVFFIAIVVFILI